MSTVTLAYHRSAEGEASRLAAHLDDCGYASEHMLCSGAGTPLARQLLRVEGPLLLLINDPFLHSTDCQVGMLDAYRDLDARSDFHPVLASSERMGPNGVRARLLTSLSRVSDVIRYMNFWQNAYLSKRKDLAGNTGETARKELTDVRRISQEIGEVLRLVRARKPTDVVSLSAADSDLLRELFGPATRASSDKPAVTKETEDSPAARFEKGIAENSDGTNASAEAKQMPAVPTATEVETPVLTEGQANDLQLVPASMPPFESDRNGYADEASPVPEDLATPRNNDGPEPDLHLSPEAVDISDQVVEPKRLESLSSASSENQESTNETASAEAQPPIAEHTLLASQSETVASEPPPPQGVEPSQFAPELPTGHPAATSEFTATLSEETTERDARENLPSDGTEGAEPAEARITDVEAGSSAAGTTSTIGEQSPPATGLAHRGASLPDVFTITEADAEPGQETDTEVSQEELSSLAAEAQDLARVRNLQTFLTHRDKGDVEEALDFARATVAADPADFRMSYALAVGLLEEAEEDDRHLDEAAEVMRQLFDSPLAAQAHLCLGQIGVRMMDYGSARRHFRRAYKLNRRVDPELSYRLGALLQDEFDQPKKAMRYLRVASRRSRRNLADAQYRLGLLELEAGRLRRAIRHLKLALQYEDNHPFAAYELAVAYLLRDRPLRALSYYNRAVRANPELDTELNRQAFTPVDADGEPTRLPESSTDKFFGFVREMDGADGRSDDELDMREIGPLLAQQSASGARVDPEGQSRPKEEAPTSMETDGAINNASRETLTVLITGAGSGIGAATARRFAKDGHRLILTGRRVDKLRGLSDELKRDHATAVRLLSFDVADYAASEAMVENLGEEWSDVDLLINNAGKALGLKPIQEAAQEDIDGMVDTNVKGLLYMLRLVTPRMVERRRGHIINVCSTAGHEVYAGGTIYCATKHAVDAITRGARLDLFRHNIRVSQVSPAAVEGTEFSEVRFGGDQERAAKVYEGFRPLHADDVAESIYQIATAPSHVNIQDIIVLSTQQGNSTSVDRSGR